MSRIGNRKLTIPEGVEVAITENTISVKGPKGELKLEINPLIKVTVEDKEVIVSKIKDTKESNILSGTTNAHINNMIVGVSKGFSKDLEAIGVGYRFNVAGKKVTVSAGYSHPVDMEIPEGITVSSPSNTELTISGYDKQKVSEFAANIRKIREPEPYKGKGIRYKEEYVRRKEGKKAAK